MTATLLPNAEQTFLDSNGKPLAGGSVYFYIPNTSTPKNTWQDPAQTILNTNPVILDAAGRAIIWGSGTYRQVVYDQFNNLVWDQITEDANTGLTGNMTDNVFVAGTDFTPGTTTQLALTVGPGAIQNTWIYFDSLYQADNQIASLNGTTLTFTSPIPVGVGIVTVKIGTTVAIGIPGSGSVTDSSVSSGTALYNRIHQSIYVTDPQFGAVGDGRTDNTAAFARVQAYVATSAQPVTVIFPAGIYVYATSPNWAVANASYEAQGEVIFRYTGTSNAVIIDGGSSGAGIYNVTFGGPGCFIVQCPSTAQDAVYVRAVHHSIFKIRVAGAGATGSGMHVVFSVCSVFYYTCSVNEGGWYAAAQPLNGLNLDIRNAGETTSFCTFINPIIEGPQTGILLTATLGNLFIGGTSEGCTVIGLNALAAAAEDRFVDMDFEANGPGGSPVDAFIQGTGLEFMNCDTQNRIEFGTTSRGCVMVGGRHSNVAFDASSKGNSAIGVKYNRFGNGSTFGDGGTLNQQIGVQDGSTYFGYLTGASVFVPGTIANGSSVVATLSIAGVLLGMPCIASFSNDLQGLSLTAYASSAGTIKIVFANNTGGPVTLASGTVFAQALKQGA